MVKNIIHSQESFTIYKEGKPDFTQNIVIKAERIIYSRIVPAWDKINYYFEHQGNMSNYSSK